MLEGGIVEVGFVDRVKGSLLLITFVLIEAISAEASGL